MFLYWLTRPIRFLLHAVLSTDGPRQLAAGFALGAWIGLTPKGNLLAVVLSMALLGLRVNLGSGVVAAFLFSWIAVWCEPALSQLGYWMLEAPALRPMWAQLYELPIAPWTSFHYYTVLGGFTVGLVACYPLYWTTRLAFDRWQPALAERLARVPWLRWAAGADLKWTWRMG